MSQRGYGIWVNVDFIQILRQIFHNITYLNTSFGQDLIAEAETPNFPHPPCHCHRQSMNNIVSFEQKIMRHKYIFYLFRLLERIQILRLARELSLLRFENREKIIKRFFQYFGIGKDYS